MVLLMENLNLAIITTQIHFAIDFTNKTQNFQKHLKTVIRSNGILSEICVRYLTYCKPDECVNMKLIVGSSLQSITGFLVNYICSRFS